MIARKVHPHHRDDPSRYVVIPLVYDRQSGAWVSLVGAEGYHTTEMDAARACYADWMIAWREIRQLARQMRTLCEHPSFADLIGDGIDPATIAINARQLSTVVEIADANIERLFDEPAVGDIILIGGALFELDSETHLLTRSRELDPDELAQSPDALFMDAFHRSLAQARSKTGGEVSARGLEQAIDTLISMLPDVDDVRDRAQFASDQRFARFIATAAKRAFEHTGRRASVRSLRETIAVLERLIQDRTSSDNGGSNINATGDNDEPTIELEHPVAGSGRDEHEVDDEPDDEPDDDSGESGDNGAGSGGNGRIA